MNEHRIEALDENAWISGVIDRLAIDSSCAHLVDFKTDRANTAEQLERKMP